LTDSSLPVSPARADRYRRLVIGALRWGALGAAVGTVVSASLLVVTSPKGATDTVRVTRSCNASAFRVMDTSASPRPLTWNETSLRCVPEPSSVTGTLVFAGWNDSVPVT